MKRRYNASLNRWAHAMLVAFGFLVVEILAAYWKLESLMPGSL